MSESNGKKKIVKVVVAIPNEGHTLPEGYDNRMQMCFHLGNLQVLSHLGIHDYDGVRYEFPDDTEFQFYFSSIGRVLTPLARERLTEFALSGNADYMFWIDDDMVAPVNTFEMLYRHRKDIVAALAFQRIAPHMPVIYQVKEGYDQMIHQYYYTTTCVKNYPKNTLVECDAVGFGCVLVDMNVVKKMEQPYFMSTTKSGEDIWFCYKAAKTGARIFMDTSVKLGHVGIPPIIEEKDYEREFKTDDHRKVYGDWKKPEEKSGECLFEGARAV